MAHEEVEEVEHEHREHEHTHAAPPERTGSNALWLIVGIIVVLGLLLLGAYFLWFAQNPNDNDTVPSTNTEETIQ